MKRSVVTSGAAILALVAGLAWAGDERDDPVDSEPGHSDGWDASDGSDDYEPAPPPSGDDWAGPDWNYDPGTWDGDDFPVMYEEPGPTCFDCDGVDDSAEMVITGAPRAGVERREARRDWRELHQANRRNVCFEADLYVPLLCDWQRPFLGDRMP